MVATVVNHYCTQNCMVSRPCVFCGNAALTVCAPHCGAHCPKTGSVLAMQPLCRSHGWTVVNHCSAHKTGVSPCVFCGNAALTICAPHCGAHCPKTGSVLAMQFLCRSHDWTVVNLIAHKTGVSCVFCGNAALTSLCPTLWSQCWGKTGSVLAMQPVQKSWLDCGKSLLHTKQGSHHVFFAAMLHSQFVPHIVVTMLQNWLGLGHAAFVQKSWLHCGKSLLHTKLGSQDHVFFAAMLHSQFVPHIVVHMCPKTGSVLAMQFLCRSHGWTVVNHYFCTQDCMVSPSVLGNVHHNVPHKL